ncbi:MAG: nitrilase-related carbon-nitrogen hydrolase [Phycisphaerales bacterium]
MVTPICYEDAVTRAVRPAGLPSNGTKRADLIVNLTNSAWYPGHKQQPQHLQIASLRCIENRVPMARSVNGGISGFIDSLGRITSVVEVGAAAVGGGFRRGRTAAGRPADAVRPAG